MEAIKQTLPAKPPPARRIGFVSGLKNRFTSEERKPRKILTGPFQGIVMSLSLRTQAQFYVGLFERETHPWLQRLSKGVATAIDIGVAHGEHTIYFLTKTKAAHVLAFEPDVSCIPFLRENLVLNGCRWSDRLQFSTKFVGASDAAQEISLDSLAPSVHSPCIVKMDVDGAEEQILQGAKSFNSLPGVRWLIETHSKQLEIACEKMLHDAGFQTRIIQNAWWRVFIPERRPVGHNRWLAAWKSGEPQSCSGQ
jgi:hypothetical protein